MKLGVCYYPEHWPETMWEDDARRMAEVGISLVRIGEFAWSRIEPEPGRFEWAWLDRAIDTLAAAGLKICLGTPTATPPKWLIDRHPDILAVDEHGQPRGFGSRRHYCFSSRTYLAESSRIVAAMAERYGRHPAVVAWQTDNEYGCHNTVLSYSADARARFRGWLAERYGEVGAVNRAWGTVFWSQEYRDFAEIDPPVGAVTETNPSHRLDYRRFASDEVVRYNRAQAEILRRLSPGRDVTHNYMGFFTEFDHHDVAKDLDVVSWDSYPLGFTEEGRAGLPDEEKLRWLRTGHPDIPSFHHDLYRGMTGRWWVMEQQPGPVNWANWNPSPLPGMVRLWTWQAFAHGAEVVSYFRWRQCPFAQEQMHAGLNRPDNVLDLGGQEATQVTSELSRLPSGSRGRASVAIVFDYASRWMVGIQPQGADFDVLHLCFNWYSSLRRMGLDVDIVSPKAVLDGYRLIALPCQTLIDDDLAARLAASDARLVIGARSFSKTPHGNIPDSLPPGPLAALTGVKVVRVESLRPGATEAVSLNDRTLLASRWKEWLELASDAQPEARFADGQPALVRQGRARYLACWPERDLLDAALGRAATEAGLDIQALPDGLRLTRLGEVTYAFNFGPEAVALPAPEGARFLLGERTLGTADVAAWS